MESSESASPRLITPRIEVGPWTVIVVLTFGLFMILLDTTIVQVAIPRMETSLNAGFDQILWIVNGYTLAYAVLLIPAGRLGDMFGPKRLFVLGLVLFTLASGACGLSQNGGQLIVFRVIQAVGGAMLTPQTLSVVTTLFPKEQRGAAFGVWGIVAGVSASIGPTLGGYLVTNFDWQAIFFINLPVGVLAVTLAYLVMPEIRFDTRHQLDVPGLFLASAGLFTGVFALVEAQRFDWGPINTTLSFSIGPTRWSAVSIYSLLVYSVLILAIFVWVERRAAQPLLPFPLFRDRNFSVANILAATTSFVLLSLFIPLVLFSQSVLGWSAVHTGLTVLPLSAASMIAAPLAGRASDRVAPKYILFVGFACFAAGTLILIRTLALDNTSWSFAVPFVLAGIGMGATMVPTTTAAMREVDPNLAGRASSFINTVRQVGGAIGTAVIGAVLANSVASDLPRQAARLVTRLPEPARAQYLATWRAASHSTQHFGTGQFVSPRAPAGVPAAVIRQISTVYHETFNLAFLNGARTALWVLVGALVAGGLITAFLRGGRPSASTASDESREVGPTAVAS